MYNMKEACQLCQMTYDTLKFYCNKGLVPNVKRDKNNYRIFDDHDIAWIQSLACLKKCGMSIKEMQDYLALCLQGQKTLPKRQELLQYKRQFLLEQLQEIQKSLDYIDEKQRYYEAVLEGTAVYQSNLISS
ncbi:MerR family transcriptional regulator [Streptococcus macacae]|uniref:Transcriptional regulator, MerR family n=1 Tax=Streptococcus macacae NCTC 11558 TaxID=764298 RepID=G5JU09_9STRE|nr:MerR family transcriptional regulator [Streptococcus macacae]EHJ51923.1 transcriptional regulator, MerR family [Streptococcus macacae NCTC 11558]SUN78376.1 MerR family transcriptional regulator [Streptococcus macacae NCTC 11558]